MQMDAPNPLAELRRLRGERQLIIDLLADNSVDRDRLIHEAIRRKIPQREIGLAAGVSQTRIRQIASS